MIQYNIKKKIARMLAWCFATLPRKIISTLIIAGLILSSAWFLFFKPAPVEAGWWDEDWLYRRAVVVTNNTTAETDVYVEITSIDTSDTTKFQADCGDLRFTKLDGTELDYYIVSGCGTASTTIHVKFDMLVAGAQTIYFYYGNSSAVNGFIGTDFSTAASSYSVGAIGSEEIGTGPVLWLKFDEGYGAFAYNSTDNNAGKLPGTELDSTHPLANGLVGLWLMNEGSGSTVADLSGNGNTGTLTGTAPAWGPGKFGSCLVLPGTDEYVQIGDVKLIEGLNEFTISIWSNSDVDDFTANASFMCKEGPATDAFYFTAASNENISFNVYTSGGNSAISVTDGYINKAGEWHHMVARYSLWEGARIFMDGIPLGTPGAHSGTVDATTNPLRIGGATESIWPWPGKLDLPMIWNRALSASEIALLYREPFAMVSDAGRASRISGASWTDSGKFDKALDFDGTDDVVTVVPVGGDVNLQNRSAYSVSAWIYPHSDGESDGEIIDKGANTYIRVANEGTDGYLDLEAGLDLASGDPTLAIVDAVRVNRWSHILLVWEDDSDDEFTIYVNGIDMGTSSGGDGAPADDSGSDLLIGGDTSNNFDGIIDEVIIYPYARSAVQAKRNYNQGASARIGRDASWITDGLVGYWKMDESSGNADDSSGAGTTLTNTGTATFAGGRFANGTSLNGSTQYFYAEDNASLSLTGDVVLSAWVYADTVSGTDVIVGKWDGDNETYLLSLQGGKPRMYIDSSSNYQTTDSATVSASTWTLVTGVYDASAGKVRLYINGKEENSSTFGTIPTSIADDAGRFHIGAEDSTSSTANFFDGKIDDVRVYNRALSSFEIMRLYDWGPGPIAHWSMDEGSGTSANDSSENSNTGTLTGDPTWKGSAECKYGNCLDFDGTGDYVAVGDTTETGVKTVSLWVKPDAVNVTEQPLDLNGTDYVQIASGTVTGEDFDSPTIYVNGVSGASTVTTDWNHIVITTETGINASDLDIGALNTSYFNGLIDDVKIYNYARTQKQIIEDMMGGRPAITETTSSPGVTMGYWRFDEGFGTTAEDSSGRGNDLTHSAEAYTMSGKFGKAWDGNGTKYLSIADDPDFDFAETEDFSISGWFKHSAISSSNDYIIAKHESGGGYKIYMDDDGDIAFAIDDDETWDTTDVIGDDQARNYDDNAWHYFTAVKRGTTSMRLYVDGKEIDNDTSLTETGSLVNTDLLYVGVDSDAETGPFDGELDEIKIYRFALSPEEILLDYNKGKSVIMGAVGTESDGTTPSWSQSRAYCPPGFTGTCNPPVGEYKFDEYSGSTAYDTSNNTNNGTISGASWKGSADCKYNSCLNFDGTDDVVTVTQHSSINMTGKSGYTMSAWIYPHSDGENDVGEIIDKGTNTYLRIDTESDGLDVEAKLDLADTDATLNISNIIFPNNWYHIVMAYEDDDDDEITIYINGANQGSSADGVGSLAGSDTNNLLIGGDTNANFDGIIDDVKIFDYALSQEQVAWVYNRGKPVGQWKFDEGEGPITYNSTTKGSSKLPGVRLDTDHSLSNGLVGLWLMNENTGTSVFDLSGNGNNGDIKSGVHWAAGKFGPCLKFIATGGSSYADLDVAANDIKNVGTVSLWVKPEDNTPSDQYIFSAREGTGERLYIKNSGGDFQVGFVATANFDTGYNFVEGKCVHITVTWSGSTIITYVNGVYQSDHTSTSSLNQVTTCCLGALSSQPTTINYQYKGLVDDLMIYNRALSASEIALLYREPFAMISDTGASSITGAAWNSSGKYNSALDFDGDDDVVTVAIDSDIDLNNKTGYSVCGWINPDSDGEGGQGEWFSKGNSYVRVDTQSGSTVEVSALFDLATSNASLNTSQTIPTSSWSHICTTWKDDADDELTIYINGINAGSSVNGSGAPADDSTSHLYIGGDEDNNFDGDIDEVTIYNYELTAEQVKIDYNQGSAIRFGE